MAELYARYIPPKKKRKTGPVEQQPASPSSKVESSPLNLARDASQSYARYVPPKSNLQLSTATNSDTVDETNIEDVQDASRPRGKSKRKKGKEKGASRHVDKESIDSVQDTTGEDAPKSPEVESDELKHDQKPERKEKKEKKKNKSIGTEHKVKRSQSPDLISKHKSVLARRAASQVFIDGQPVKKQKKEEEDVLMEDAEPQTLHALEPLPQPEPRPEPAGVPSISALPSWLENPIRVLTSSRSSFEELGLDKRTVEGLRETGIEHAFAVQSAVLPLLLPGPGKQPGDVLVSAATGSGKTLSYVLPLVNDLCRTTTPRLRALIVLPTRELVNQAREVCESCANASTGRKQRRIKIGVAIGSQALKTEQGLLMEELYKLDPGAHAAKENAQNARWEDSDAESDDDSNFLEDERSLLKPGHIKTSRLNVDVLICTPGRLVEHLKSTPCFTLDHVKWLVIDEADRLLDQSFQQWLPTVMARLPSPPQSRRDRRLTKVVLSATMTRDIGLLSSLRLYRPKLVVLDSSEQTQDTEGIESISMSNDGHVLPEELVESALKVEDEGDKPLYLLKLLEKILGKMSLSEKAESESESDSSSDSSSDSNSDDDSDSSSDTSMSDATTESTTGNSTESSSTSSESNSLSESDSDDSDTSLDSEESGSRRKRVKSSEESLKGSKGVLIFTKSNEATLRLSRLLTLLEPSYADNIGTLTSTVRNSRRRTTIHSFRTGKLSILVASDLVSRGLDLPDLAHVVNYDIPTSLTSYVHRVGRTARAGKEGNAWTLFTNSEARWFWNEVARSPLVKRTSKVKRVNLDNTSFDNELRQRYEDALKRLGKETESSVQRPRK